MEYFNNKLLSIIWIVLPIYLIIGLLPIPFWYYASIRWVILAVCIYISIIALSNDFPIVFILMLCIMFIFRPIYPFIIEGIMWGVFNIAVILLFSITIYYLKEDFKRRAEINLPDLSNQINNVDI